MKPTKDGLMSFVLMLVALVWGGAAIGQGMPTARPNAVSPYEKSHRPDLDEGIRKSGEVGVIVGLTLPRQAGLNARNRTERQREADIANVQNAFVSRMSSYSPRHIKKMRSHPYVAMHVEPSGAGAFVGGSECQDRGKRHPSPSGFDRHADHPARGRCLECGIHRCRSGCGHRG